MWQQLIGESSGARRVGCPEAVPRGLPELIDEWVRANPAIGARFARGGTLLDVKCGHGEAVVALARAFPKAQVYGFDASPQNIAEARRRSQGVPRLHWAVIDWRRLPVHGFDLIAGFDAVFDSTSVERVRRALSPGGIFVQRLQERLVACAKDGARLHG